MPACIVQAAMINVFSHIVSAGMFYIVNGIQTIFGNKKSNLKTEIVTSIIHTQYTHQLIRL